MSPFQILSTRVGSDGWMDMNVLSPYGIISIEFHVDEESVPAVKVTDCLHHDGNDQAGNMAFSSENLMKLLLALRKDLENGCCEGQIEPFESVYKNNPNNKSIRIVTN